MIPENEVRRRALSKFALFSSMARSPFGGNLELFTKIAGRVTGRDQRVFQRWDFDYYRFPAEFNMALIVNELQSRTIGSLEARLEKIALLPAVISRLTTLDLDSAAASDEILTLVRNDPPLALRLMRLANAQSRNGIDTIPDAVLRVGTHNLAHMILALSVVEVFVPNTRPQRNLWIHSIQVALAARRIAAMCPEIGLGIEQCFLAGLLHDIGRFVIFEHQPQEMAKIDEVDVADPHELVAAEIRACGFDHAALGYEVCRRWKLPESVTNMVRSHHMYGEARRRVPGEVAALVRVVQQADCFSFGLLRKPASAQPSVADRNTAIEAAMRSIPSDDHIVPVARLREELMEIDREARAAAAVINLAYT